jgi:hypothetical protein
MGLSFDGDSNLLTVPTGGGPATYRSLARQDGPKGEKGKVYEVTVYCPDGSDPNIAANTDTVYAGPAGTAGWPLGPGATKTWYWVNPWDMAFKCASASQKVYITFGGSKPTD